MDFVCVCMWTSKVSCVHVLNKIRQCSVLGVVLHIPAFAMERKVCV